MTTALGMIMQELSLLEYDSMTQTFQQLIPRSHSLLAYHMWMKRSKEHTHRSFIHIQMNNIHNEDKSGTQCPICLQILLVSRNKHESQLQRHIQDVHFIGTGGQQLVKDPSKRKQVIYSYMKVQNWFVCCFGCRDGSVTLSFKKMINHYLNKHTDEELKEMCMTK